MKNYFWKEKSLRFPGHPNPNRSEKTPRECPTTVAKVRGAARQKWSRESSERGKSTHKFSVGLLGGQGLVFALQVGLDGVAPFRHRLRATRETGIKRPAGTLWARRSNSP